MLGGEDSQKDLSEFVSKSRKQDSVSCIDRTELSVTDHIDNVLFRLTRH